MDNIVIVTGGFDPLHSGHIAYINAARQIGRVVVGLNSDDWLKRKKGSSFMPYVERCAVVSNLKDVMTVIDFDDSDNTAIDSINKTKAMFPKHKIIFANGGDRNESNIPELDHFKNDPMVEFAFGIGGSDKKNSSSWILNEWKHPSESRVWGRFLTYYDSNIAKVKRLVLDPGKSISMQYHEKRSELWFVEYGVGVVSTIGANGKEFDIKQLNLHDYHQVSANTWHKLKNTSDEPLSIIEIQYGSSCCESDIIRN